MLREEGDGNDMEKKQIHRYAHRHVHTHTHTHTHIHTYVYLPQHGNEDAR